MSAPSAATPARIVGVDPAPVAVNMECFDGQGSAGAGVLPNAKSSPLWPLVVVLAAIAERVEPQRGEVHSDKLGVEVG